MLIEFLPVTEADRDALVAFMAGQSFPFHVSAKPSAEEIAWRVDGTTTPIKWNIGD